MTKWPRRQGLRKASAGLLKKYRVAMLCSEEDPAICHRGLLVGRVQRERGAQVDHIRGDGRIQADNEVFAKNDSVEKQGKLFDADEAPAWKSIPSVYGRSVTILLLRLRNSGESLGR
jgi:hypothetical protein